MKKTSITLLVLSILGLQAYGWEYVWHFNLDENLAGTEVPISPDTNWNLSYSATALNGGLAANTGSGDGFIVSGNSEGSTGGIAKPLPDFTNNDRGFIFGSGAGDSTTGYAPQALFFWTSHLTTVNVVQGAKGSGTVETDWMSPDSNPLSAVTLGQISELFVQTLPRNLALVYRLAFEVDGTWYVDATGHTNSAFSWENYSMTMAGSSVYPLPFTPGVEMDIEVTDNTLLALSSLDQEALVTGYGLYVDTGDAKGTSNNTGSWARADAFYINAVPEPATFALLLGAGAFGLILLRRRNRR
ncbi:MAG: PEP-CTERM sorting domain-containing protein [Oceanipulchritudo sp.]